MTAAPFTAQPHAPFPPVPETSAVLAEFGDYQLAQGLVDRLSDARFPVERVRIVGLGITSVEQVTGRMTKGKAAWAGAAGGAWVGLLIGFLFGLFTPGMIWVNVLLGSVCIAAVWGAILGFVAHWGTGGRRDFKSVKSFEAERYAVMVDAEHYAEAAAAIKS